jgi:hypothetical protein
MTYLRQGGALYIFDSPQFAGQLFSLVLRDGFLLVLGQLFHRYGVVTEIDLRANQQEWRLLAVMCDLRHPLLQQNNNKKTLCTCLEQLFL